eukprot:2968624-Prymnesium_polylepis.1
MSSSSSAARSALPWGPGSLGAAISCVDTPCEKNQTAYRTAVQLQSSPYRTPPCLGSSFHAIESSSSVSLDSWAPSRKITCGSTDRPGSACELPVRRPWRRWMSFIPTTPVVRSGTTTSSMEAALTFARNLSPRKRKVEFRRTSPASQSHMSTLPVHGSIATIESRSSLIASETQAATVADPPSIEPTSR